MLEVFLDTLRSSIFITGLVVVMMMLIEICNISSNGKIFQGLRSTKIGQILVSALLGAVPGCMGGFASVSLYTHKLLSFGALLAMMVATAGDEAFMMLALFPGKAMLLFAVILVLGIVLGIIVDYLPIGKKPEKFRLDDTFEIHEHDHHHSHDHDSDHGHVHEHKHNHKHFSLMPSRIVMLVGLVAFIVALLTGGLEESGLWDMGLDVEESSSEEYMFWFFAACSLIVVGVLVFASDHFVKEHLWEHVVKHHLPEIFAWTFGVLMVVATVFHFWNPESWIRENTAIMILLAVLMGCLPQSGPHMIFVALFATGVIPFPVLLANTICQEGHAGLPLLAESKASFLKAKGIKIVLALVIGFGTMLL